jgi:hypothetical protein
MENMLIYLKGLHNFEDQNMENLCHIMKNTSMGDGVTRLAALMDWSSQDTRVCNCLDNSNEEYLMQLREMNDRMLFNKYKNIYVCRTWLDVPDVSRVWLLSNDQRRRLAVRR